MTSALRVVVGSTNEQILRISSGIFGQRRGGFEISITLEDIITSGAIATVKSMSHVCRLLLLAIKSFFD